MNDDILSNGMKACGVVLDSIQKSPTKSADTLLAMSKCIDALYELVRLKSLKNNNIAYSDIEKQKVWVAAFSAIEGMDEIIGRM